MFHAYTSIYCQVHPTESSALFTYSVRIKELSKRYPLEVWRTYDTNFRKLKACQPSLPWQQTNMELLVPRTEASKAVERESNKGTQPFRSTGGSPPKDACHPYYYRGTCDKPSCKFQHVCGHCKRRGHSLHECRQYKNRQNKGKKRPSSTTTDLSGSNGKRQ